jgi:hypothetical protein
MKESQEEVRKAVLDMGNALGMSMETPILLTNIGIYSTIKELVYKAFVVYYDDYFEENDKVFQSVQIVKRYCKEMAENGEVEFDVKFIVENSYIKCFDKFDNELHDGDIVDVQMSGLHNIYKKEDDGQLYFKPYGKEERVHTYFRNDMIKIDGKRIDPIPSFVYPEIPIVISKYQDGKIVGWRAEIADDYENYESKNYEETNFEDLSFHFEHGVRQHDNDNLVFITRKDAIRAANYCNEKYLSNKAKIWVL